MNRADAIRQRGVPGTETQTSAGLLDRTRRQVMDRQVRDWSGMWLWLLPVYALLTFVATLTHQPDPETEFGAWSEYVTTSSFFVSHVVGGILASALLILGVVALGLKLATSRRARAAHAAVFATVLGTMGVVGCVRHRCFRSTRDRQRFSLGD